MPSAALQALHSWGPREDWEPRFIGSGTEALRAWAELRPEPLGLQPGCPSAQEVFAPSMAGGGARRVVFSFEPNISSAPVVYLPTIKKQNKT